MADAAAEAPEAPPHKKAGPNNDIFNLTFAATMSTEELVWRA
jgi:hypothetical protein